MKLKKLKRKSRIKRRKRPRFFSEIKNIRTLPSGYQVAVTRNKKEYSKHFAGHSRRALKAAERWRDRMLRLLPAKRKNAIARRVLTALGLKQPVVGVSYHPRRNLFQVSYSARNGRMRGRSFHWSSRGGEIAAYAAAVRFRKGLLRSQK
jgi:hypothetical protein